MSNSAFRTFSNLLARPLDAQAIGDALKSVAGQLLPGSRFWLWKLDAPAAFPPFLTGDSLHFGEQRFIDFDQETIDAPWTDTMRSSGITSMVPLVFLGQMVDCLLVAGPRELTINDALVDIATLAAAALLAASPPGDDEAEEMRIAQSIQRRLLPQELPALSGWQFGAHYQPARVVGGDLYDFIALPGDLIGIVVGDASDKGIPAALMMATARTLLRAAAQRLLMPGRVLAWVNDALAEQSLPGVFVTCFFAILDPVTARLRYANAGQSPPIVSSDNGSFELRLRGWPLGLMPGAIYDEAETTLAQGATLLCFSDGLLEARNAEGELLGTTRLLEMVAAAAADPDVIGSVLNRLEAFTGPDREAEDDLTIILLKRDAEQIASISEPEPQALLAFNVPSEEGVERMAAERIDEAVDGVGLSDRQRARLKTAVAETVMNAAEHGNRYRPDLMVQVQLEITKGDAVVRIIDHGQGMDALDATEPDLEAKLSGTEPSRGWGRYLIEQLVDRVESVRDERGHVVELVVHLPESPIHNG
jgi:anti-sigma regulatory factor (Ser/Thr protein kinase)